MPSRQEGLIITHDVLVAANATRVPYEKGLFPKEDNNPQKESTMIDQHQTWAEVAQSHPEYIGEYPRNYFVAGGGGSLQLGNPNSEIWQEMVENAKMVDGKQTITLVGIPFAVTELETIGDFYRWLHDSKNKKLHCIDERLHEDEMYQEHQVHHKCGACGAFNAARGLEGSCEDDLLIELGEPEKQPIRHDMQDAHDSLVVHIDLSTKGRAVKPEKREELCKKNALAFNVSLPLEYMLEFCSEKDVEFKSLMNMLVRLNVQVARNIIGSHHNDACELAEDTLAIVDTVALEGVSPEVVKIAEAEVSRVVTHQQRLAA